MTELDDGYILLYYPEETSENITSSTYKSWCGSRQKDKIATFLYDRHFQRYLKPFMLDSKEYKSGYKNGFSMMASYCLLIETIEGFYRGWPKSRNELAFLKFFSRDKNFEEFSKDDIPTQFYQNIRCGILHQGETSGGWKITRKPGDPLLNKELKSINATKFGRVLDQSLRDYTNELKESDWDKDLWKAARDRMKQVIKNCRP